MSVDEDEVDSVAKQGTESSKSHGKSGKEVYNLYCLTSSQVTVFSYFANSDQ